MKWVVFGSAISSSWNNPHATHWRALALALAQRGIRLVYFERDTPYHARHRDFTTLPGGGQLCLYQCWQDAAAWARRQLLEADVAIVTSLCLDGAEAARLVIGSSRPLRLFWDLDPAVTLGEVLGGETAAYLPDSGLRDFDLVLSAGGGQIPALLAEQLGARQVTPMYPCVDPLIDVPSAETGPRLDLAFLGSYHVLKHPQLERLLLSPARSLPHRSFSVAGPCYPACFATSRNVKMLGFVPPAQHSAFYSSARMALSFLHPRLARLGHYPTSRLLEAAAAGTPLLIEPFSGLGEFLTPKQEVLTATDAADVAVALGASDQELCRIALAARERVLAEHSAERRAEQLLERLERLRRPEVRVMEATLEEIAAGESVGVREG